MSTGFKVVNRCVTPVFCSITNKTNPSGSAGWFEIQSGSSDTWNRSGWEDVHFKNKADTKHKSLWINRGAPALVYFDDFDKDIVVYNEYKPEPSFVVNNRSDAVVLCWISTFSAGSPDWYKIEPGENETWKRTGWETIAFRTEDDKTRKGIYVNNRGTRVTLDFHGFDKDIAVEHTSDTFLLDEHYAEAIVIADNSHAAQSTRASSPGGLTASISKIDTLELITTGKSSNLGDHNQIYKLALLIDHVKHGLAEPAIVVSVTPEWVKVAAYTCEFDAIVVLGFPTDAIDIIAPGKQRPGIGARLLVVSLFTSRSIYKPGVQGDITMGSKTLDKWYNFQPLVAQYVTDDFYAPIWAERLAEVDEDLWGDIWEGWLSWKERHGENYFRLGAPSKVQEIATHHDGVEPPGYTP